MKIEGLRSAQAPSWIHIRASAKGLFEVSASASLIDIMSSEHLKEQTHCLHDGRVLYVPDLQFDFAFADGRE